MLRHAIDKFFGKFMSRKLMVWLTATGLMLTETVPLHSDDWVAISLAYIGIRRATKCVSRGRSRGWGGSE